MHIAEGFLPPVHAAAWTLAAAPFVVHGARRALITIKEQPESRLLLAAAGAFTFVLSALKMPSVTGSSSHPTGTGAGAVIFRPPVMAFLATIVLLFQALLLAHGGVTTLGANVFSMGVVGPWAGYCAYRLLVKAPWQVAIFAAFFMADLSTYLCTSFQLGLAHPDPVSGLVGGWLKYAAAFGLTQIPLAVVEGLIGIVLFKALHAIAAPELTRLGFVLTNTPAKAADFVQADSAAARPVAARAGGTDA